MIHYTGPATADYFYSSIQGFDYDIIVLSYYPGGMGKIQAQFKQIFLL